MGCPEAEVSITLVDDDAIAELAGRFGRPAHPTDVLSFPLREGEAARFGGACLGDVILSVETAERQAGARGMALDRELSDLLIHGMLHLLGMDHERSEDTRAMRGLEQQLRWELDRLGVPPFAQSSR